MQLNTRPTDLIRRDCLEWMTRHRLATGALVGSRRNPATLRASAWAVRALADAGDQGDAAACARWLVGAQGADGGFPSQDGCSERAVTAAVAGAWTSNADVVPELRPALVLASERLIAWSTPAPPVEGAESGSGVVDDLLVAAALRRAGAKLERADHVLAAQAVLDRGVLASLRSSPKPPATMQVALLAEALLDLGCEAEARQQMNAVSSSETPNGAVAARTDASWIAPADLAQLALVWYRLRDLAAGDRVMSFLLSLQTFRGGFFGSMGVEAAWHADEEVVDGAALTVRAMLERDACCAATGASRPFQIALVAGHHTILDFNPNEVDRLGSG